jgi:DNA-binding phage protein
MKSTTTLPYYLMILLKVVILLRSYHRCASLVSRKGVQKALSENGNPQFGSVNAIMHAMGYRLTPEKLPQPASLGP